MEGRNRLEILESLDFTEEVDAPMTDEKQKAVGQR
jgi:hypothetical protein